MSGKFVRTQNDFAKLSFTIRRSTKGYKEIIGKSEAKNILATESDKGCLEYLELAEIAANGGCLLENQDVLYAA